MVRVQQLTAEVLLSDPRRGPAVPNRDGTHALYTVSAHVLGGKTRQEVRILNIETGKSTQLSSDPLVHDALWIPSAKLDIIYLRSAETGRTQVLVASAADVSAEHYLAAEIDAPVSNLKLRALDNGSVAFVVTALVGESGLYNQEAAQRGSTARVFDTEIPIWNASCRPNRCSLWYNELALRNGRWELQGELFNLFDDIDLEAPSNTYTDAPCNDFDICRNGIAFVSRNLREPGPDGSPALSLYFVRLDSFCLPPEGMPRQIFIPTTFEPASITNVRFTPDSSSIGFLYTAHEDPYNTRLFLASVHSLDAFDVFGLVTCIDDRDDNPPTAFEFAGSSDSLILQSHQLGHRVLSHLTLYDGAEPETFFTGSSCSAFYPLREGDWSVLFTTSSNFVDSSLWQIVNVSEASILKTVSSATKSGAKFDLAFNMVTELWYEGANSYFVHCWMIRPQGFDENKKYPWVLVPRGSPGTAWNNEWSTTARVNASLTMIAPLCGIRSQRGDKPFQDLLSLITYLQGVPYLDEFRATLVGSSGAAYLLNKILGHDIANKFCCAVYHSGSIDPPAPLSRKEPAFESFDQLNSSYTHANLDIYENDMVRSTFFNGWKNAPPTLIIHGEKDKQCSLTEALTAFNSLQAQGIPSRLLTFPDESHVTVKPENTRIWYDVVWEWVRKCSDGDLY
ncbi:alpha/beta-hydrolase [Trichoderma reesei RUT C-30]|uniref:Dipeptidyl-peptidase V n=1 Tax=Hypocrea jecorina (strain ATCC 56765 / BCRC 32924 / NRRL 11460 / Rut C-30) TaxID=1344414 RepID=A0A024SDW6_HYPJR|nr:alpha/beta-hydrolase [Trichoderma reesei RUT C-30]